MSYMKFLRVLIKRNARLILLLTKKGRRISPRPHIYLVLSSLTFDTSLCVASCFTSSTPLASNASALYWYSCGSVTIGEYTTSASTRSASALSDSVCYCSLIFSICFSLSSFTFIARLSSLSIEASRCSSIDTSIFFTAFIGASTAFVMGCFCSFCE